MEWVKQILLGVVGLAGGLGVAGGVFTTLIAVGLIPRFAGKTHTAKHIFLYEEMVVCGTILGGLISVFFPFLDFMLMISRNISRVFALRAMRRWLR